MNLCLSTLYRISFNDVCRAFGAKTLSSCPKSKTLSHNFVRHLASYRAARTYNPDERIEYEVSVNPEEWKFVDRLLPYTYIPEPTTQDFYPSSWTLPKITDTQSLPYFLRRTKNHMIPVYLKVSHRGMRRLTVIRQIKGDVWLFEKDVKAFLEKKTGKDLGTRIDEVAGKVTIKGDHVNHVLEWVKEKGF